MARSRAKTVEDYLAELNDDRRLVITEIRQLILQNIPPGYAENMNWGMISYEVPLERFADTYNKQPLMYLGLAAQKNYYSLYLMNVYQDSELYSWLESQYRKKGKKLNMGKSCLRFKKLDELPLAAIVKIVKMHSVAEFIEMYQNNRA